MRRVGGPLGNAQSGGTLRVIAIALAVWATNLAGATELTLLDNPAGELNIGNDRTGNSNWRAHPGRNAVAGDAFPDSIGGWGMVLNQQGQGNSRVAGARGESRLEALEGRQLLSVALEGEVLWISGTPANDTIEILDDRPAAGRLNVSVNGQVTSVDRATARMIRVEGGAGSDRIAVRLLGGASPERWFQVGGGVEQDALIIGGDAASLDRLVVSAGGRRSVFSGKTMAWGSHRGAEAIRWAAVRSVRDIITSVTLVGAGRGVGETGGGLDAMAAGVELAAAAQEGPRVALEWRGVPATAVGCRIERRHRAAAWESVAILDGEAGSFTDDGVAPGETYSYRVRTTDEAGSWSYSQEAMVSLAALPVGTVPAAPTRLAASGASPTSIRLTWADASSDETGFAIERKTAIAGVWQVVATAGINATSYMDGTAAEGTQYVYRIAATGTAGSSAYSNEASGWSKLNAPTAVTAKSATTSEASVTWMAGSDKATGYRIERNSGTTWVLAGTVDRQTLRFSDVGLDAGVQYVYRVRAFNASTVSTFVNAPPVATRLQTPTGLAAQAISGSQVELKWIDNASSETEYRVMRKAGPDGLWATMAVLGADATGYIDGAVVAGGAYTYRIRAYNSFTYSDFSDEVAAGTSGGTPAAPSGLVAAAMSESQVQLTWLDNSTGEDGFKIIRRTGETGTWVYLGRVGANVTGFVDTGLDAGTQYSYEVKSFNSAGSSGLSNEASATTLAASAVLIAGTGWTGPTPQPAAVGSGSAADEQVVARWDVTPYQMFSSDVAVGLPAFHVNGIDRVTFSVNNGPWVSVRTMTLNPQTNVVEYWATLKASGLADGPVEIRAVAYPKAGVPRVLEPLVLFANTQGTLDGGTIYVSTAGADTNAGTAAAPLKTIGAALNRVKDGGRIVLATAGSYAVTGAASTSAAYRNTRWITIEAAPGLAREQVIIRQATRSIVRPAVNRLRWRGVSFDFGKITQYYNDPGKPVWFDNVRWFSSDGWAVRHTDEMAPVRQDSTGGGVYVTDSLAEDMLYGFVNSTLARNVRMERISGDALQNSRMVINAEVKTMRPMIPDWHLDVLQLFGGHENTIIYGMKATDIQGAQGIFVQSGTGFNPGTEPALLNAAFVNIRLETNEAGGPPFSQYDSYHRHVLFQNVQWVRQNMLFRDDYTAADATRYKFPYKARNVVFDGCTFTAATWKLYGGGKAPAGVTMVNSVVSAG